MRGSNGNEYMFLLKGHEDLRQDERVMQFFSLVNSLLTTDPETFRDECINFLINLPFIKSLWEEELWRGEGNIMAVEKNITRRKKGKGEKEAISFTL